MLLGDGFPVTGVLVLLHNVGQSHVLLFGPPVRACLAGGRVRTG